MLTTIHRQETMTTITVKRAKDVARQWVVEAAGQAPGFCGAFYAGSVNWSADEAVLPATSDVDMTILFCGPDLPDKPGIVPYRGILLDVSHMPMDRLQSPDLVLGDYHLAGAFRKPNVILDPTGQLARLQAAVSEGYPRRRWVYKRCEHARDRVLGNIESLAESMPLYDQVLAWLFAAGVTTHILLVAGLKSPTVRRRYVAVRELLAEYGCLDFYETLLELLGCAHMSRAHVEHHLAALTEAFDAAKGVVRTPFFFASAISDTGRPLSIDGSRQLIEESLHREAVFWIVATYSRCQKVLYHDAPAQLREKSRPGYEDLLADLGITSFVDLQQRGEQIKALLPQVWKVAEEIIEANPDIVVSG